MGRGICTKSAIASWGYFGDNSPPSTSVRKWLRVDRGILVHELVLSFGTAKYLVQRETFPGGYRRAVTD